MEWRPIETAPRDGTQIILRGPHRAVVAWWGDLNAADSEFGTVQHDPLWCWLGHGDCKSDPVFLRMDYLDPTEWAPIIDPPAKP